MAAQGSGSRFSTPEAGIEEIRQTAVQGFQTIQTYVERNPLPAALVAFGLGVGLGMWLGSLAASPIPERPETMAERLGHRTLDFLGSVLPESVVSQLRP